LGVILTVVLHFCLAGLVSNALATAFGRETGQYKGLPYLAAIGLVQLFYMIPAILIARWRGHMALAKGLIVGAALTFLLNATCWVIELP
jgi:hypothetical protein